MCWAWLSLKVFEPLDSKQTEREGGRRSGMRWILARALYAEPYAHSMWPKQNNFTSRKITLFTFLILPHSQSRGVQSRITFVWKCLFRFLYSACSHTWKQTWVRKRVSVQIKEEGVFGSTLPPSCFHPAVYLGLAEGYSANDAKIRPAADLLGVNYTWRRTEISGNCFSKVFF